MKPVFVSSFAALLSIAACAIPARGAEVTFRDDFDSSQLQAGWQIIHEDPAKHSLNARPGFFRLTSQRGALEAGSQVSNLILRPASGDFIIESYVEFNPQVARQFAGIAVYADDQHSVALGLAFASGDRGTFRGIVLLSLGDESGPTQRPGERYDASTIDNPNAVYLRLLRSGDQFIAGFSADGRTYTDIGSATNPLPESVLVGLGAANGDYDGCGSECDTGIPADFDYFQISSLGGTGGGGGSVDVPTLQQLALTLPDAVDSGGTAALTVTGAFSDGSTRDVTSDTTWIVAPPGLGSVDNAGLFSAGTTDTDSHVTIVASFTQLTSGGVSISKTASGLVRINGSSSGPNPASSRCFGGVAPFLLICGISWLGLRGRVRQI